MARLPVSKKLDVLSPECVGCLDCVAVCPIKDCLGPDGIARQYTRAKLSFRGSTRPYVERIACTAPPTPAPYERPR